MRRVLSLISAAGFLTAPLLANALPFSAETTTRESLKIIPPTSAGGSPTYEQLLQPSESLSFQETSDGRLFTAFVSQDERVDGTSGDDSSRFSNWCRTSGRKHIYWVDKSSNEAAVCVSTTHDSGRPRIESSGDSSDPLLRGADRDVGRYIFFHNRSTEFGDIYDVQQVIVHDRKWEDSWLSQSRPDCGVPTASSYISDVSRDGKFLLFNSNATNLDNSLEPPCVAGNGYRQMFIRDGSACEEPDSTSFGKCDTKILIDRYAFHADKELAGLLNGDSNAASLTADASLYAFESLTTEPIFFVPDLLGKWDIFLYSRPNERVSLISQKAVALTDRKTGEVSVVNVGGPASGDSRNPKIDLAGKYVVFDSYATDLVMEQVSSGTPATYAFKSTNGKRHVYLYNKATEQISMISVTPTGDAGNGDSSNPWISDDGRFIVFESTSTNLLRDKTTTSVRNIFVRDLALADTYLVTTGPSQLGLNADASITDVGPTGLTVAYETTADNAIVAASGGPPDTNGVMDVFLARNGCPDDLDNDKTPDCLDLCPTDTNKNYPGQCGCEELDTDTDGDTIADCVDECAGDPNKSRGGQCGCGEEDTDSDGDGTADCVDICPNDRTKTTNVGVCGCGRSDDDANGNGSPDCFDPYLTITPEAPRAKILSRGRKSGKMTIEVKAKTPLPNKGFSYQYSIRGPTKRTVTSKSSRILVRNLKTGSYSVSYRIVVSKRVGTRRSRGVSVR